MSVIMSVINPVSSGWRRPPRVEDDAALPKTDAAGRPFADEHQAARYALSRDALKAREAAPLFQAAEWSPGGILGPGTV